VYNQTILNSMYIVNMSRIIKYRETLRKFMLTKSFLLKISGESRKILDQLLFQSDNLPGIIILTVLNSQCKKNSIKIHGYYLATAIECLMQCGRISCNRNYYESIYGSDNLDNMFNEVIGWFHWSVSENIETLRMNCSSIDPRIITLSSEYCLKYIPNILKKYKIYSSLPMKKSDIYCYNFPNDTYIDEYKKKNRIEKDILKKNIDQKYGAIISLGMCIGWLIGCGSKEKLHAIEKIGKDIGMFLKMAEDLTTIERDALTPSNNLNYVINHGIKEAYSEFTAAKICFVEGMMTLDIDSKTIRDILETVMSGVDDKMGDISVDMLTHYDDCSAV